MNLEIKIYVISTILQELLDETEGETPFKYGVRYKINALQKELDKVLSIPLENNELSLHINRICQAIEDELNNQNNEQTNRQNQT